MSTDCPTPLLSSGIPLTYAKLLDKSLVGQQQNVSKSFAGWMRHISHTTDHLHLHLHKTHISKQEA